MQSSQTLAKDDIIKRNNVKVIGDGNKTLMLAHGFGCDQNMWRFLIPLLQDNYQVILFDYTGSGASDLEYFDSQRYLSLEGYARDVLEIINALALTDIIFVGHSVSCNIGLIAANQFPDKFSKIIMVCPSPCFLNDEPEYLGGFEQDDLEELINLMDKNYIGWANHLAPLVMGAGHPVELVEELTSSFCSTDLCYLKPFAKATFLATAETCLASLRTLA
jgi:sigma-B regulation protein RsbQ